MSTQLDIDDVCADNPLAIKQLAELRAELARLRKIEQAVKDWILFGDGYYKVLCDALSVSILDDLK